MRIKFRSILLAALLMAMVSTACRDLVLGDEPKSGPVEMFELFWNDFDQHYAFFELKQVDWDSIYAVHRPQVHPDTPEIELFRILSDMLDDLKDGHVNLYAQENLFFLYNSWRTSFPKNYAGAFLNKEINIRGLRGPYKFGFVRDTNIGYLRIKNFSSSVGEFEEIESILDLFDDTQGLILDMRGNGGGFDTHSRLVAGYFTPKNVEYAFFRYKNGPGQDNFTRWIPKVIKPATDRPYRKPVTVLTNRSCFSACEDFVLGMRNLKGVTVVGDTTGGGAGSPIGRELPNGWTYRIPRWQQVTHDFRQYEGRGIYPDRPVWISKDDSRHGVDTIFRTALKLLKEQSSKTGSEQIR